jgi:hypothetical protein
MARTTSQVKLQLWRERFEQFRQGHQTVGQFCQCLGCTTTTFHYWQRKLGPTGRLQTRRNVAKSSAFVPVVLRGGNARPVVIRVNDGTRVSVPVDALSALDAVLQHAQRVAR